MSESFLPYGQIAAHELRIGIILGGKKKKNPIWKSMGHKELSKQVQDLIVEKY